MPSLSTTPMGIFVGDNVLRVLAGVMIENCRAIDSVARMGGEEFGILFPECSVDDALIALERIRKKFESNPMVMAENRLLLPLDVGWISVAHPPIADNGGCAALIHPTIKSIGLHFLSP